MTNILDKYKIIYEPADEELKKISKMFKGCGAKVQLQPGGWTYLPGYPKFANEYANFEWLDDDVIVATMPKSGTTWAQEIVWTMRMNPDLDPVKAAVPLNIRTPNFEADMTIEHVDKPKSMIDSITEKFPDYDQSRGLFLQIARVSPRPRTIKTHLPFELISPTALEKTKIVYVIRDPRDVCLSYMHHCRLFMYEGFQGTVDDFVNAFINGLVTYGPYWEHLKQAWDKRDHPNLCIVYYEKLKNNSTEEYQKLNKFLNTKLTSEQLEKVIHFTSFTEMKNRENHVIPKDDEADFIDMAMAKNEGGFFRQGTSGGWRKVLNQEQKDKFEAWIKKKCPDQEIMNNILNP